MQKKFSILCKLNIFTEKRRLITNTNSLVHLQLGSVNYRLKSCRNNLGTNILWLFETIWQDFDYTATVKAENIRAKLARFKMSTMATTTF
jgi:hypothetical protein